MILKHEFKVYKDSEGQFYSEQNKDNSLKEIVLDVRKPNYNDQKEAQFHYSKTFSDAIKNNVPSRVKMEQILKENGEWSEEDIHEGSLEDPSCHINIFLLLCLL
jgi:hypothetical protein